MATSAQYVVEASSQSVKSTSPTYSFHLQTINACTAHHTTTLTASMAHVGCMAVSMWPCECVPEAVLATSSCWWQRGSTPRWGSVDYYLLTPHGVQRCLVAPRPQTRSPFQLPRACADLQPFESYSCRSLDSVGAVVTIAGTTIMRRRSPVGKVCQIRCTHMHTCVRTPPQYLNTRPAHFRRQCLRMDTRKIEKTQTGLLGCRP